MKAARSSRRPGGQVAVRAWRCLQRGRDVAAGVLQQVGQVPGGVGAQGVLEVQQADAGHAVALGQPQQVLGVVVAVGEDAGAGLAAHPDRGPQGVPFGDGRVGERRHPRELRPPFQEGVGGDLQRQGVVGQQRPGCAARPSGRRAAARRAGPPGRRRRSRTAGPRPGRRRSGWRRGRRPGPPARPGLRSTSWARIWPAPTGRVGAGRRRWRRRRRPSRRPGGRRRCSPGPRARRRWRPGGQTAALQGRRLVHEDEAFAARR